MALERSLNPARSVAKPFAILVVPADATIALVVRRPTMGLKLYTTLYLRLQTSSFCFIKRTDHRRGGASAVTR
jgi:hypothetical protein